MQIHRLNKYSIVSFIFAIFLMPDIHGQYNHKKIQMNFNPQDRTIDWSDPITGRSRSQHIPGPGQYINCDSTVTRRLKGRLTYENGEPAKFFPILDRTTLKSWSTDKLGFYDIIFPGDCAFDYGSYGFKYHGQAFLPTYPKSLTNLVRDLQVDNDTYVIMLSEDVPDNWIRQNLFGSRREFSEYPRKTPLTQITGAVPAGAIDFHPFLLHKASNQFFSGSHIQGKFWVHFLVDSPFTFLAYSNKPKGKVVLYAASRNDLKSDKRANEYYDGLKVEVRVLKELTYSELSDKELIGKLLDAL